MSKETQHKKRYLAPSWRVVSFKTERGFATSNVSAAASTRQFDADAEAFGYHDVSSGTSTSDFANDGGYFGDAF